MDVAWADEPGGVRLPGGALVRGRRLTDPDPMINTSGGGDPCGNTGPPPCR